MNFDLLICSLVLCGLSMLVMLVEYTSSSAETFSVPFFMLYFSLSLFFLGVAVGVAYQMKSTPMEIVEMEDD